MEVSEKINAFLTEFQRRKDDRKRRDWETVLSTPQGRRVVYQLLSECKNFSSCVEPTFNPYATYYLEGKRDIGLLVQTEMQGARASAYAQMIAEVTSEQKADKLYIDEKTKELQDAE